MTENMTATVETNEVNAAEATATPVETNAASDTATADKPKSKRERKAERKAKLADKAGKPSKGRKNKATGDDKPARVEPTERDAFGNRKGTSSAAINATILASRVPLTAGEIHERTGAEGRKTKAATRQHCLWLLERGHIRLKDGGYVKAERKPRKAKAGKPADETAPTSDESKAE